VQAKLDTHTHTLYSSTQHIKTFHLSFSITIPTVRLGSFLSLAEETVVGLL